MVPEDTKAAILACLVAGDSYRDIKAKLKVTDYSIAKVAKEAGIAQTQQYNAPEWFPGCGMPSPQEIKRLCREIRATWTPEEAFDRWQGPKYSRYIIPHIAVADRHRRGVG